mgnify:CR=1 FL=1
MRSDSLKLARAAAAILRGKDGPVLDPFMVSGTTGVAAVQTGHTFIGIDQAEHWCQVAERRIRDALGQSITLGNQTSLALDGSS